MSTGIIKQVAPTSLIVAANVRTDTKLTPEFVASIKEHGVYVPITVHETPDGLAVIDGQRRTLAAVDAGVKAVPVYVVAPLADEGQRIVEQLVVNDHRASINETEQVAAYQQLELFGMPLAAIAKKTGATKDVVIKALGVAKNESALQVLEEHELTLDQAAVIVEFADDEKIVKELVKAAGAGQIEHIAAKHRAARILATEVASLAAELDAEDVIRLTDTGNSWEPSSEADKTHGTWTRVDRLGKPGEPTAHLEVSDVAGKPFLGARVTRDHMQRADGSYGLVPFKQYFVLDYEANGVPNFEHAVIQREQTPEEIATAEERARERAAEEATAAALSTAKTVRDAWIEELLQRKTIPGVVPFVAKMSLVVDPMYQDLALSLVRVTRPTAAEESAGDDLEARLMRFVDMNAKNGQLLLLAGIIAAAEHQVAPTVSWKAPSDEVARRYLPQLAAWGYGLSEAEQTLIQVEADAAA